MTESPQSEDPTPNTDNPSSGLSHSTGSGLATFWEELKRRKVMRVAIAYAIVGWLLIQVTATVFPQMGIPDWAAKLVTLMLLIGFPIALIIAWAFELTPDGIKTSKTAREEHPEAHKDTSVQRKRNGLTILLAAGLPTAIFGTLALFFYLRSGPSDSELVPTEQVELENDKSIAVLPLTNMSPDPENAFFADGVQEDILTNLSKIDEFRVISRTSTVQYKDTVKTMTQISEELEVRYLVEGSVRRAGDQVLVTVQLIDTIVEQHIWAESYNRKLDDIFAIQAAVAKDIAGQLQTVLSPNEIATIEYRPTENQEAYDYYTRFRVGLDKTNGNWDEWIPLLEKAVSLDPNFAEAWAMLSIEYGAKWRLETNRSDSNLIERAHYALDQAKRLKPDSAYVSYAQSFMVRRDREDPEIEIAEINFLLEALARDPSFSRAQTFLGYRYLQLGRLAEAQHHLEAAIRTDPLPIFLNGILFLTYQERRLWKEARALGQRNLARGNDKEEWQEDLAVMEYYRAGDKQALLEALEGIAGFMESHEGLTLKAFQSRDYSNALRLLEENEAGGRLRFLHRNGFRLGPLDLVASLIFFELKDADNWQLKAKQAKRYFEERAGRDVSLAICHALLGERGLTETTIAKARERRASSNRTYRNAVISEMHIAIAYLVLGDHEKAIETLEVASKMDGPMFLNRELDLWFIFDRLRGNPRFDALLK